MEPIHQGADFSEFVCRTATPGGTTRMFECDAAIIAVGVNALQATREQKSWIFLKKSLEFFFKKKKIDIFFVFFFPASIAVGVNALQATRGEKSTRKLIFFFIFFDIFLYIFYIYLRYCAAGNTGKKLRRKLIFFYIFFDIFLYIFYLFLRHCAAGNTEKKVKSHTP